MERKKKTKKNKKIKSKKKKKKLEYAAEDVEQGEQLFHCWWQ